MPSHSQHQISPYTTQQLFDLVSDIESYPAFLPWCRAARILEQSESEMLAELVIAFSHLTESYTSRVILSRPESISDSGSIDVTMVKGPFQYLTNKWHFSPRDDGGCDIEFALDFKFRSRIMEKLIGTLFTKATVKMVSAFSDRADELYAKEGT